MVALTLTFPKDVGSEPGRLPMHQASILMTALVMIMGGVWYAMNETRAADASAGQPAGIEQSAGGGGAAIAAE